MASKPRIDKHEFIMPTAINIHNIIHENIVNNFKNGQDSNVDIASLYRLAFMVYHNTGELLITRRQ